MRHRLLGALASLTLAAALGGCGAEPTGVAGDRVPTAKHAGADPRFELNALLTGSAGDFSDAKGKARFRVTGQRELQIEVENVPQGTQVNFFVAGFQYGETQTVDTFGRARIDLTLTDEPSPASGDLVTVETTGGTLVASGNF